VLKTQPRLYDWVPHFEKMLYDNAQLACAYLNAFQCTGETFYGQIAQETLQFIERELTHPQSGFFSSLDADSQGEEGKFYTWQAEEIESTLSADWQFFRAAYGISATGNWQGQTILQRALDDSTLAARFALPAAGAAVKLAECHAKLLAVRNIRPRPNCDDKIITAWNGLTLSAFARAARAFPASKTENSPAGAAPDSSFSDLSGLHYLNLAVRSADFLLTALRPAGKLLRAWRNGKSSGDAALEDYAALVLGLLDLYETDFNNRWFCAARELADEMIAGYSDPAGGFFDTLADGETLLLRPKDLQDNATPSGNALAAEALLRLAALTDCADYRARAEDAFRLIAENAVRYPTAYARWLSAVDFGLAQVKQIAILGALEADETLKMLAVAQDGYHPNRVVAFSTLPLTPGAPALLENRPLVGGNPSAYVCEGFTCKTPVTSADALKALLKSTSVG